MNKLFFVLLLLLAITTAHTQSDQDILLTVNGKNITVGEFRYIYEKNNGKDADYSKKSLAEYLDLYSKFKLKVERAKDLRIDTIQSLKDELAGYKKQLANSYLMDKEVVDQLVKEVYDRAKTDIRFSHILLAYSERNTPAEWDEGLVKIKKIKEDLEKGKSWESTVKELSEDKNSREKNGDLGFFTSMMPSGFSELELAIYSTPIGKISAPVKTKIGYHLIKVTEQRPARGQIEIAHILLRKENAKNDPLVVINEIHNKLKSGEDFAQLAATYSEDQQTAKSGGLLKPFGIGNYELKFEEAAFALQKDGDISTPIETKSGWHILKRIRKINAQADSYAQFKKQVENKIKKDDRYEKARLSMVEDIKKAASYSEDLTLFSKFKSSLAEDFLTYKWAPEMKEDFYSQKLISLGKNFTASLKDFVEFTKKNTRQRLRFDKTQTTPSAVADILLKEFSTEKTVEFEQANLESKYPDFKALLKEYEEGILLFEATKQAVWDKANEDSIGLEKFYASNKASYMSEEKVKLMTYAVNTKDIKLVEKVMKEAEKNDVDKVLKKFNKKESIVSYQEEVMDKAAIKFKLDWKKNAISAYELNPKTNIYQFGKVLDIIPSMQKSLKEAKGYVVADYQDHLEKQWVDELKKSYEVKINEAVYNKLIKP